MFRNQPLKTLILWACLLGGAFMLYSAWTPLHAQEEEMSAETQQAEPQAEEAKEKKKPVALLDGEVNPNQMNSVLFTYWEQTAINDARRSRGLVRKPTKQEVQRDLDSKPRELTVKPPPEERDISLGGIVYVSSKDWTIWLNGKRVTPQALPEEVIDLKVFKEYIEVKWFDVYTNQVFPIRLRSHQRFNIDTRIFLPG